MNYQLSVGFNGKKDTLLKIINSSNKVGDVYTGGLSGKIYGGRFQYEDSYEKIKENIEICHKHGITLSITLIAQVEFQKKVIKFGGMTLQITFAN